jgi:cellulose synthase/poly-beta-1,6-N-acetylglucosamine synthase-like glycosyltransferase
VAGLILAAIILAFAIRYLVFLIVARRVILKVDMPRILSKDQTKTYRNIFSSDYKPHDAQMRQGCLPKKPFVSILLASYNESNVIDRLMKSISELSYGLENFEVIAVDDSNDGTVNKLQKWLEDMPNLKVFYRNSRKGWKGGALNFAISKMCLRSAYALVVDADHVLERDTLEKCVQCFASYNNLVAVQGFPIPSIGSQNSWVSRGIFFRLARRNLIEFVAKGKMELPVQLTGSLFMIRADVLRKTRFSHDLTEDWELTLALHLQDHGLNYNRILFHPFLIAYCEAPSRLYAYFRQRSRVSEGHTRGFKKRFPHILRGPLSIKEKTELLFTGMQYAKFLLISALLAVTCARLFTDEIIPIGSTFFFITSLAIQAVALSIYVVNNIVSTYILGNQNFNYKDILFLVALNLCTFSAFVVGSLRGLLRQKGTFFKTERSGY